MVVSYCRGGTAGRGLNVRGTLLCSSGNGMAELVVEQRGMGGPGGR